MLNRYSLWQYLLVLFLFSIISLYALPNLYSESISIQIKEKQGVPLDLSLVDTIRSSLSQHNLAYKSISIKDGAILVNFFNDENNQSDARKIISEVLGKNQIVSLKLVSSSPNWLKAIGANPMKLGLDLRGGVHFLMEVEIDEGIMKITTQRKEEFRSELREKKVRYQRIHLLDNKSSLEILFYDKKQLIKAKQSLKLKYPNMTFIDSSIDNRFSILATFTEGYLKEIRNNAVEQNIVILRNRIDELGVSEPLVYRQGLSRIVVELPGVQDIAHAKQILGATAVLEFREVDNDETFSVNKVPMDSEIKQDQHGYPIVLKKAVILDGSSIIDANAIVDQYGRPEVNISLDQQGGEKMLTFSRHNIGKLIATVFTEYESDIDKFSEKRILTKHEKIINQASIQSVLGRNFRITGIRSISEARNLALLLRAGTLNSPISIIEERTIGASMGKENIKKGIMACVCGFLSVILFTLFYYRKFGLIANIALVSNLVLIIGIMSMIPGATMTLPGIAGILLTVGMAVDANVLIFERIREELRNGCNPQQAIHYGYKNAFSTITDANLTTLITAVVLFVIGTGVIKGFAITLSIGILTSMFTAIIGTRCIVNLLYGSRNISKLSI
ncbi:protein translocase subunit SecD [Candidatus Photodesmus anomalopis]|uniref:protein translocase subunit SecD n=1 Tax=Candidatus Photodesmus anomalopis TaxID=28176 RepID=UPI00055926DB|nr:protein translocase subunit SecD [Candidatus Photodesmus katoptron]